MFKKVKNVAYCHIFLIDSNKASTAGADGTGMWDEKRVDI
jgi:hypothetical protein